jgi:hypothetical protein
MATRDLIVLVPGLTRFAQGEQRESFIQGLVKTSEDPLVRRVDGSNGRPSVVTLEVTRGQEVVPTDVQEAYWNDLVPSLTAAGLRARVVRGLALFLYWAFSPAWRGFLGRKYLTVGLMVSGIALVVWYYGVLALFLDALLNDPGTNEVIARYAEFARGALEAVAGWKIWLGASVIMGLIPVAVLIDIMDFCKRYLVNEPTGSGGIGLHVAIRDRVRSQVLDALKADHPYDRLVLVSHSFGTVVAVDVLADLPLPPGSRVRFVTLGSPVELLVRKAPWLQGEIHKCCERPDLEAWIDIRAENDWFATGVPRAEDERCRSLRVPVRGTIVDTVTGRTHARYFDQEEAVAATLGRGVPP